MNVTSHWTSLAVLGEFDGDLLVNDYIWGYDDIPVVVGLSVVLAFMCTLQAI